jgi:hypothetical protein
MALKSRRTALLAVIETVYGTDAVPTGADNAVLVRNVSLTPMETQMADRTLVRPYFGSNEQLPGAISAMLEFEVEMAGSGAAGTAPAYGTILRGCAMSETVNAGVSVVYAPVSGGEESLTLYYYLDGVLHKVLGARGSVSMKLAANEIPVYAFKFTGLYVPVADAPLPTVTLSAWQKPVTVNTTNTTGFALHGFAGVLQSMDVDVANEVTHRQLVGSESVIVTNRQPAGSVSIEAPLVGTKDFFAIASAATTGTVTITHGPATNQVKIDAASVQLTSPKYSDQNGISNLDMSMRLLPVSGNDEFTITVM